MEILFPIWIGRITVEVLNEESEEYKEDYYDYVGSDMHGLGNFERFLPDLRLKTKEIDKIGELLENNKKLFG